MHTDMTTSEIKLPPLPEAVLQVKGFHRMYTEPQMEAYARAAVEADRAARKPLTQDQIDYGFAAQEGVTPFQNGVRFAERHHGIGEG